MRHVLQMLLQADTSFALAPSDSSFSPSPFSSCDEAISDQENAVSQRSYSSSFGSVGEESAREYSPGSGNDGEHQMVDESFSCKKSSSSSGFSDESHPDYPSDALLNFPTLLNLC